MKKASNNRRIEIVKELGEVLDKRLSKDVKLSPFIRMEKGFLEELARQIRRIKNDKPKMEI